MCWRVGVPMPMCTRACMARACACVRALALRALALALRAPALVCIACCRARACARMYGSLGVFLCKLVFLISIVSLHQCGVGVRASLKHRKQRSAEWIFLLPWSQTPLLARASRKATMRSWWDRKRYWQSGSCGSQKQPRRWPQSPVDSVDDAPLRKRPRRQENRPMAVRNYQRLAPQLINSEHVLNCCVQ